MRKNSIFLLFIVLFITSCQPSEAAIQTAIVQTQAALPTATLIPPIFTPTIAPTDIPTNTPTIAPTPIPQTVLLRGACGHEYKVKANEPVLIYYGGWGTTGLDLSQQWTTSLVVDLNIDTLPVLGEQSLPVADLPLNCPKDYKDSYWLYYTTTISGLSSGVHNVTVIFNTLRALPDYPGGKAYVPGPIAKDIFTITAE